MGKIITFLIEVKNELAKVVWPSRAETTRYTAVVILFSLVVAGILGGADYLLLQVISKIINH